MITQNLLDEYLDMLKEHREEDARIVNGLGNDVARREASLRIRELDERALRARGEAEVALRMADSTRATLRIAAALERIAEAAEVPRALLPERQERLGSLG